MASEVVHVPGTIDAYFVELYNGGETYSNDIDSYIELSDLAGRYVGLVIQFYKDSIAGTARGWLFIPSIALSAGYYSVCVGGTSGWVRMQIDGNSLYFVSSSISSLFVQNIYGAR